MQQAGATVSRWCCKPELRAQRFARCCVSPPQVLASVTISEPRIPCYSNVTAEPFGGASEVAALLPRQLVEPVQWEGTVRKLVAAGARAAASLHGCAG